MSGTGRSISFTFAAAAAAVVAVFPAAGAMAHSHPAGYSRARAATAAGGTAKQDALRGPHVFGEPTASSGGTHGWLPAVGSARAARAAAGPGWRLVHQFGVCESDGALAVTATSASNAWATGQWSPFSCGGPYLLIAHWDGTRWSVLRSPAGFAADVGHAVAALSASYAWIFANNSALLWQNNRWRTFQLATGATINSAVAFTTSNAWGFGQRPSSTGQVPYAVHFNGQRWSAVTIPVLPQGTASPAPGNIWAVGPLASATGQPIPQPYALAHWTGRWQTIPFPNLHLPPGEGVDQASVVADNAAGAWIAGDVGTRSNPDMSGVLLHWTGSSWVNVTIPFQTTGLGPLSHDGHGGLWMYSICNSCVNPDMVHYNSAGQWSLASIPGAYWATATAMRLIPGTDSVWASAILVGGVGGDTSGGMLKYGP